MVDMEVIIDVFWGYTSVAGRWVLKHWLDESIGTKKIVLASFNEFDGANYVQSFCKL